MRAENQKWDAIRAWVEIVNLGVGQTVLTVTCVIRRLSDDLYLQAAGGWAAGVDTLSMTAYNAANFPGVYVYEIAPADLDQTAGAEGYEVKILEATFTVREHVLIVPES